MAVNVYLMGPKLVDVNDQFALRYRHPGSDSPELHLHLRRFSLPPGAPEARSIVDKNLQHVAEGKRCTDPYALLGAREERQGCGIFPPVRGYDGEVMEWRNIECTARVLRGLRGGKGLAVQDLQFGESALRGKDIRKVGQHARLEREAGIRQERQLAPGALQDLLRFAPAMLSGAHRSKIGEKLEFRQR
ncbi:MAG TPA: hypothetical protein VKB88_20150, partial [Bryobacteraceae bacterium]|nr:hypothetical protein [Bryobacteraceae bacterium]